MVNQRLTPEQFLQRTEEEERKQHRGKLKIYLGAAPGVGKTYTMLHDALEKRASGLDIVIGIVESHGRQDIEKMLEGFELLPQQSVHYRGKTIQEFDLDAALARNPGLILIDEMAHTNVTGLRHSKRWQDIKECLDRGIDVYTTLNVQHIESLKDDVAQIIQTTIRETVPDSMIEMANTIELVDLPPEELIKRLQDGKVYFPQQAELATENFFRKGNLIALRELALRATAERVGTDVLLYRQSEGITQIWPTQDKILVCVGPRLDSLKLIRAAKQMASSLQSEWVAVYVDVPKHGASSVARNNAIQNLRLAEQLGADTHVLTGFDIVKEIMEFAHAQNVTQIMLRKHIKRRWSDWFRRNLSDEIVRNSGDIDVYIMTSQTKEKVTSNIQPTDKFKLSWKSYLIATGIIAVTTLINLVLFPFLSASNLVMIYLLSLVGIALFGYMGVSIFASITTILVYDFFFVPPYLSFAITDLEYGLTLFVMLIVAQVISYLTILTRRQTESAHIIQYQTTALYALSRQLTKTRGVDELVLLGIKYIAGIFKADVIALLPKKNQLEINCSYPIRQKLSTKERSIAQWVFEMGLPAGLGTDTLSFSKALYLPLLTSQGPIGVLRIQPENYQLLTPDQLNLLDSCVHQVSLALEVDRLHEKHRKKELKTKTEQARIDLLETISKNLQASIKIIVSGMNVLKKRDSIGKPGKDIEYEVTKLNKLNNNILRIIQLEFQEIKLLKKPTKMGELIQNVIETSHEMLKGRRVETNFAKNLPSVSLNEGLIQEVLFNLIDNAVKFTPAKSPITIDVRFEHKEITVSVEDVGAGVSPDERTKLFETFYRGKQVMSVGGLGLGLAICQKIINIHGGRIWVENLNGKGAAFRFTLPI